MDLFFPNPQDLPTRPKKTSLGKINLRPAQWLANFPFVGILFCYFKLGEKGDKRGRRNL